MVTMDLRINGYDDDNRGIFYEETGRIIVYLKNHETLDDIMSTIQHEFVHKCIADFDETLDDDQEEKLIYQMAWAEDSLA
tara:strand:- start:5002 stop:5241 length:240 start_codon:yes stop_codon:yes gene_type:complete